MKGNLRIALVFTITLVSIVASSKELPSNKLRGLRFWYGELQPIQDWLDASGLANRFSIDPAKHETDQSHLITLNFYSAYNDHGFIESDLYRKIFVKVVSFSGLSLNQVELQIRIIRTMCALPNKISIRFVDGIIRITDITDEREPHGCAMLHFEGINGHKTINHVGRLALENLSMPLIDSAANGLSIEKIKHYLQERYEKKGGNISNASDNDKSYAITVRNIQREVIKDKNFWERLQIIVLLEKVSEGTKIHLIIDGKYASGLAAPSDLAYSDMETTYTSYLNEYGKSLLIEINRIK